MNIEHIAPPPEARHYPPLSLAVKAGETLYVSGVAPYDAQGGLAKGDFSAQMKQVLANLDEVLRLSGASRDTVVKCNVLLTRPEDVAEMNRLYADFFGPAPYPARTTSVVLALPVPDFLLEIECVAILG
ncbi:RidA family protein [Acetobacteraceae bacterium H6797]|nr:RidA family protein [Acetobacteraceae bacterium H6797]